MDNCEISGRWVGHYVQNDRSWPIVAEFVLDRGKLTGVMVDVIQHHEYTFAQLREYFGATDESIDKAMAMIHEHIPNAARDDVRYVCGNPGHSAIDGFVIDRNARFTKTYQGERVFGFRVNDRFLGFQGPNPPVHYDGRLNAGGDVIEGRWSMESDSDKGIVRLEGIFRLRRERPRTGDANGPSPDWSPELN
ncbi:hypothetical protein GC170_21590 [bacterium]|nr:hypothetical protein [bacterium]